MTPSEIITDLQAETNRLRTKYRLYLIIAAVVIAVLLLLLIFRKHPAPAPLPPKVAETVQYRQMDSTANGLLLQLQQYRQRDSSLQSENDALATTSNYWKARQTETENNLYAILHLPARAIRPDLDSFFTNYLIRYYNEPDSSSAVLSAGKVDTNR